MAAYTSLVFTGKAYHGECGRAAAFTSIPYQNYPEQCILLDRCHGSSSTSVVAIHIVMASSLGLLPPLSLSPLFLPTEIC